MALPHPLASPRTLKLPPPPPSIASLLRSSITITPPFFSSPSSPLSAAISNPRFSSTRRCSALSPPSGDPPSDGGDASPPELSGAADPPTPRGVADEWGEPSQPEPSYTKLSETDPTRDDDGDEWGADDGVAGGNGRAAAAASVEGEEDDGRVDGLKRCLVDSVYGTDFGFQASAEVRAEVSELVNQLEASNPTPAPTEAPELLQGNWILVYTASSELVPLLAAGSTPLLRVEKISQVIDTSRLTIENSTTLSSPLATLSFSASASFEVRSPSRIQVQFKEGVLQPPEIKSAIDLPGNVDVFGQNVNLLPLQQVLNPLLEQVGTISRAISGQTPLRIPVPRDRPTSWLLTTYLDKDLRVSRGDGGLFVLVKEGSPLLV